MKTFLRKDIYNEKAPSRNLPPLLTEEQLNEYLHEIDLQAHAMLDDIIPRLAKERGIDEWTSEMNNIKANAEGIVLKEVVYK